MRGITTGRRAGQRRRPYARRGRRRAGRRRRPYVGGKRRGVGVGCWGVWFDTPLRRTTGRLTTNGWGGRGMGIHKGHPDWMGTHKGHPYRNGRIGTVGLVALWVTTGRRAGRGRRPYARRRRRRRVGVGCFIRGVVRHGAPGTAPRLTTNGYSGRVGCLKVWFDTGPFDRLRAGSRGTAARLTTKGWGGRGMGSHERYPYGRGGIGAVGFVAL